MKAFGQRAAFYFLVLLSGLVTFSASAAGKAKHVIVMVWDGMRPEFVTAENTPNLWRLAGEGVVFANHHSVFLSATEVNGTAIATGVNPERSGIIANKEYWPEIDQKHMLHMEGLHEIRVGDKVSGGRYLKAATTSEILQRAGFTTAIAGAKPVAILHDRAARPDDARNSTIYSGSTLPEGLSNKLAVAQGVFPAGGPNVPTRNDWTTRAVVEQLWKNGVTAYTVLWLNEPDWSQHKDGPGSPLAMVAIKNADDNLGRVLKTLKEKGVLEQTDILLVSDHGFSTIGERVNLADSLKKGGFNTVTEFKTGAKKDEIMVVSNGGSYLFYVTGHDKKTICKLVSYLQQQSYAGVIFTKEPNEGTFTLAQAKLDSPKAPDILMSMRWTGATNEFGVPGFISSGVYDYGDKGMHVSLSKYDMHNTLIAAGPDFRRGITSQLPTGNVDVAPTVLAILGVKPPKPMDGRVLSEALNFAGPKLTGYQPKRLEASCKTGDATWNQYLNFTEVNGVVYFDEGNGSQAKN